MEVINKNTDVDDAEEAEKVQNDRQPEEIGVIDDGDDFDSSENTETKPAPADDGAKATDVSSEAENPDGGGFSENSFFKGLKNKITAAKKPILISVSSVAAALLIVYIICIATLPTDTVARNVYVEKLSLGGLSYNEALDSIKSTYMFEGQEITMTSNDQTFSVNELDIGLTANPDETAQKAFNYGKTGNTLRDALTSFGLLFHRHTLVPAAQVDTAKLDEKINEFGIQIFGNLAKHTVEIGDGKAIVHPGRTGYNGNPEKAREEVINALKNEQFTDIPVTLESSAPEDLTLQEFDNSVYKDPTDAYFVVENNDVKIVPEENGRYINKDEAAALLANVHDGGEPVEIPYYTAYADMTEETLKANLFNGTMASYSTSYGGSTANRASNVARAAELINGTVVAPGEVFSFNDTVGKRTVENGFSVAKEYVDGKSVDGIGGGTCQVSSTLYSAVLYASLEIVTRTNHMFTVSYIPNGQDATVSDSGVDFKFRNNSKYPIKIVANAGGGTISVSIIGTGWDPPRSVKIVNSSSTSPTGVTTTNTVRYTYNADGALVDTHTLPSSRYNPYPTSTSTSG